MIDNKSLINIKDKSTNKSFGIIISFIFFLFFIYPLIFNNSFKPITFLISILLFIISFLFPRAYQVPNIVFIKLGYKLGSIISPIVMFLIYILAIVPIGFLMKTISSDFGELKIFKQRKTYWEDYNSTNDNLKDQF